MSGQTPLTPLPPPSTWLPQVAAKASDDLRRTSSMSNGAGSMSIVVPEGGFLRVSFLRHIQTIKFLRKELDFMVRLRWMMIDVNGAVSIS